MKFSGLKCPQRFTAGTKFRHCLDLLDSVITEDQKTQLQSSLESADLETLAGCIAEACMVQLDKWKSKPKHGIRTTTSYAGMGMRVATEKKGTQS